MVGEELGEIEGGVVIVGLVGGHCLLYPLGGGNELLVLEVVWWCVGLVLVVSQTWLYCEGSFVQIELVLVVFQLGVFCGGT